MFGIPFLLIGIILVAAGAHWFASAVTVGWIIVGFSLLPILVVAIIAIIGFIRITTR